MVRILVNVLCLLSFGIECRELGFLQQLSAVLELVETILNATHSLSPLEEAAEEVVEEDDYYEMELYEEEEYPQLATTVAQPLLVKEIQDQVVAVMRALGHEDVNWDSGPRREPGFKTKT
ncbi:hypothetical protein B0T17DRAFT_658475 [Bombardia bombarda]|uniref:Uncharacterized protein n=1 Tax=Bombardia bombarda TaxID=252184 RepID=A0AA39WBH0_9PEZI|nr:hypothetical protein B0T17DRAFT_658475 [Bombardia bombarda]